MSYFSKSDKTPNLTSVTFPDGSVLSSAKTFETDVHFKKRVRIDKDLEVKGEIYVEDNIHIGGKIYSNDDVEYLSTEYVDEYTGWGLPQWTTVTGNYTQANDSLIVKIYNIENNYSTKNYVDQKITESENRDSSRYLIGRTNNTVARWDNSSLVYSKRVTYPMENSIFLIRGNDTLFKLQRSSIGIGKVLTCVDDDGTIDWQSPTAQVSQITEVKTNIGIQTSTSNFSFRIIDGVNDENGGFYYYPSYGTGTNINQSITPYSTKSIIFAMGKGILYTNNNNPLPRCIICPFSYGSESIIFAPASNSGGEGGYTLISGGVGLAEDQYIKLGSEGILIKPKSNTLSESTTPGYILSIGNDNRIKWIPQNSVTIPENIDCIIINSENLNISNIATINSLVVNQTVNTLNITNSSITNSNITNANITNIISNSIQLNGYFKTYKDNANFTSNIDKDYIFNSSTWYLDENYSVLDNTSKILPKRWGNGNGEIKKPYFIKMEFEESFIYNGTCMNFFRKRIRYNLIHRFNYRLQLANVDATRTSGLYYSIEKIKIDIYRNGVFTNTTEYPNARTDDLTTVHYRRINRCRPLVNGWIGNIVNTTHQLNSESLFIDLNLPIKLSDNETNGNYLLKVTLFFQFKYDGEWIRHTEELLGDYEPFYLRPAYNREYTNQANYIGYIPNPTGTYFIQPTIDQSVNQNKTNGVLTAYIPSGNSTIFQEQNGVVSWFYPNPGGPNTNPAYMLNNWSTKHHEYLSNFTQNYWYSIRYVNWETLANNWSAQNLNTTTYIFNWTNYFEYNNYRNFFSTLAYPLPSSPTIDYSLVINQESANTRNLSIFDRVYSKSQIESRGNITTLGGFIQSCGYSGRRGIPISQTNSFSSPSMIESDMNSYNSINNFGNIFNFWWTDDGKVEIWVDYSRVLLLNSNTCDYRLKNIKNESGNVLMNIKNTKIYDYSLKSDVLNETKIGVIAHELQENFKNYPSLVSDRKDSKLNQTINHFELNFILLKGIQELIQKNEELEKRLAKLEHLIFNN